MSDFTVTDLVRVAARVLNLELHRAFQVVDVDKAESVIKQAQDESSLAGRSATVLAGIVTLRPFHSENKQIAALAAIQLIAASGFDLDLSEGLAMDSLVSAVERQEMDEAQVQKWVEARLRKQTVDAASQSAARASFSTARAASLLKGWGLGVPGMQRFTDRARRPLVTAQQRARELNHNHVGAEHLLLALVDESGGVAAVALDKLGVSPERVRAEIHSRVKKGEHPSPSHLPFTPTVKSALAGALREALQLGHMYIGTEHLLLGLLGETDGIAAQVLTDCGVTLPAARAEVVRCLSGFSRSVLKPDEHTEGDRQRLVTLVESLHDQVEKLRTWLEINGAGWEDDSRSA